LSVNPDKNILVVFTRKTKLPGFFDPLFFGVTLHRSVSWGGPGFSAELEQAWKYQGEEGSLFTVSLWCDVGTET